MVQDWHAVGMEGHVKPHTPAADDGARVPPSPPSGAPPVRRPVFGADPLRLIAYVLVAGIAVASPFALQAGAEFFLPLTAAIVIATALVPALEWMERRAIPSPLAALLCVLGFILLINGALALIVIPASDWFIRLPARLPQIRENLAPLIDAFAALQRFVDDALQVFASNTAARAQAIAVDTPSSVWAFVSESAPAAAVQTMFATLFVYFFLAGWSKMRRVAIGTSHDFDGAIATSRTIRGVVEATSAYMGTIIAINLGLGLAVAGLLWLIGMPSPLMWGGIVAICNFIPYLGPVVAAMLLALGGLMSFDSVGLALLPAAIQITLHTIEANFITPLILGRRLTINPLLILISLSFWGWVWGAPGAFLAVPILVVIQAIARALYQSERMDAQ